jgi:hypothetical protein
MIWNIQLVFDAADPDVVARFWGIALDYNNQFVRMTLEEAREWRKDYPQYDGRGRMDDEDGRRMPIYLQRVPEPKQGPNRVQLEISAPDEPPGSHADDERNEYTVIAGPVRALRSVVFECVDADRMLEFWSKATGYVASSGRCDAVPGAFRIEGGHFTAYGESVPDQIAAHTLGFKEPSSFPDGVVHDLVPGIAFRETGEVKRCKNRLHLDLRPLDRDAERARLEKLGATVQRWDTDHVMVDPEGNEFCVG